MYSALMLPFKPVAWIPGIQCHVSDSGITESFKPFTAKDKFDETKKTSKFWTV